MTQSAPAARVPKQGGRDHRVDALRGVALAMMFVDHIPDNLLNRLTLRIQIDLTHGVAITSSIHPPKYPAMVPNGRPMAIAMTSTEPAIPNEVRAP